MLPQYDHDGDNIELSEEDLDHIEDELKIIDLELARSKPQHSQDLSRQRAHLQAELAAGRRLPLEESEKE